MPTNQIIYSQEDTKIRWFCFSLYLVKARLVSLY